MDEAVLELIRLTQDVGPELWEIARQRLVAEMFTSGIWVGIWFGIATAVRVIGFKVADKMAQEHYDFDEEDAKILKGILLCGSIIFFGVFLALATGVLQVLIAPDYAILKIIFNLAGTS